MGAIELRGVAVDHDGTSVLRDVHLAVADGEVVALLGRSGSGKTSLLRVVAGHDPVAAGRVVVGGRDVTGLPPRDRRVGMVAQGAPLQPTRDVEGNLRLPFDLRGEDRDQGRRRALGEALRFGLDKLLGRRPRELSEGQRAATAMARSVVSGPSALLLDEPAASLDHQTRARVLQQVGVVQRTRGTTVLVATNQLAVASSLADRVAVLGGGTVAQVAPLAEIRARPATLDVADLVHRAPLARLDGEVVTGTGGRPDRVVTAAGAVATWHRAVREHDGPVLVGLAQHDLDLGRAGRGDAADGADGELVGTVLRCAPTGPHVLVTVDSDAGRITVAVDAEDPAPRRGDRVGIAVRRALVATSTGEVLAVVERP